MFEEAENTEPSESSVNWAHLASLETARTSFRDVLRDRDSNADELWESWLRYFISANYKGLSQFPARAIVWLVSHWRARKVNPLEDLDSEFFNPSMRVASRSLIALAENPGNPPTAIADVESLMRSVASRAGGSHNADASVLRLATAAPMGLIPSEEDLLAARRVWEHAHTEKAAEEQEEESDDHEEEAQAATLAQAASVLFCDTALGQILVEGMMLAGRESEALDIAKKTVEWRPCIGPCALAPQGMLSRCLEPLWRRGERDLAERWLEKLSQMAPPGYAWIGAAGARIAFQAGIGHVDQALKLVDDILPYHDHPETSPWRRMQFHFGAARALGAADRAEDARSHVQQGREIASAFDRRNGNPIVSRTLALPPSELDG